MSKEVHVAVGVITRKHDNKHQILISKRLDHLHQGGLWEFPGGKVEVGESVQDALARELLEELGIELDLNGSNAPQPLIKINHCYVDKSVLLDVWVVSSFIGEPQGMEGQQTKWVDIADLDQYEFPAANGPIISACRLPSRYVITASYPSLDIARKEVAKLLENKPEMLLFRQPELSTSDYLEWARLLCRDLPGLASRLILSGHALSACSDSGSLFLSELGGRGMHVSASVARELQGRPVSNEYLFAISCHNQEELDLACELNADFVTLSPVRITQTHPHTKPLGWKVFADLVSKCKIPVYALGGISLEDEYIARKSGAQGIAGIRLWQSS